MRIPLFFKTIPGTLEGTLFRGFQEAPNVELEMTGLILHFFSQF